MKCSKCQFENPEDSLYCSKCASPLQPSKEDDITGAETIQAPKEELTTGSTFAGRYQIIEELGRGGMGNVYKAIDTKIEEKIALKLLKPEIASDRKTIERFSNELKFARKIRHANVCQMYDLNEEKGTHYITMEYVHGEDLKRLIRKMGQMSSGQVISIAKQLCKGLAEAHRLGVVHRDLKPQNIMVDEEGNARIMDFGIARSLKTKGITEKGLIIGTPDYMSPEQVEGKGIDHRSDIYSLGIILYEMVTGRVPFEGETPLSIAMKHKSEIPKDPREFNAQIPDDLNRVILKCLEKEKENRFQNTEELLSELRNIEKGIPTTEKIIPERKPLTSREITVTLGLKKLLIPSLVLIAVIVIGVLIWRFIPQKEEISIAPGKPTLAVMYFKNNTGDESLDHWRSALSDLLITDLAQSKYIRVLSGEKLFNIMNQLDLLEAKSYSSDILKEVSARGRVDNILVGNYTKAGDTFRINITLQEASTGELIGSEKVEGIGEKSFYSMVDELTRRIKASFKLSTEDIASDIDKEVGEIATNSPEAYKFYSDGRKYHHKGDYQQAILLMEKAVAIDPEFAMAFRSMAMAYGNLGYVSKSGNYLQKAFELSERVSDRERYQIQGDYFRKSEKTYDKAIEAYSKLLELYPEDTSGNNNLGILYLGLEEFDKAVERFKVCIQNKDESIYPYGNLASAYWAKGLYDKASEVLMDYLNNISDNAEIRTDLASTYIYQQKYDLALVEVDKAFSLDPSFYFNTLKKADIYHYMGELDRAEEEYQRLLGSKEQPDHILARESLGALYLLQRKLEKSKEQIKLGIELTKKLGEMRWKSWFHLDLAYVYLKSGNSEEALEECDKAWNIAEKEERQLLQKYALFYKGLAYLRMKSINEAQRTANELKVLVQKGLNRKPIRYYNHLLGMIELKRGNYSEAIEYFEKAISLLPFQHVRWYDDHALFIDPLASAYYRTGDLDKARVEYEKIASLTTGRLNHGDIFAKSFYNLGKIHQENGEKGRAIEHYEKFLNLWKDADPGIPEIIDAKKRLTALQIN